MERFISDLMNGNLSPRVVPIVLAVLVITAVVLIRIVRWPRQDIRRGARRDHVAVIYNGVILIGLGAAGRYIWTAIVLLAAVALDALARRGSNPA
jgi:hypothetical protein